MSGDDVLMMPASHRVEVFTGTGRRRRWSPDQKAQIVDERYTTSISEAAARYDVSRTQLFTRWRDARQAQPRIEFAKIEVEALAQTGQNLGHGVIEITVGGGAMRLGPGSDVRAGDGSDHGAEGAQPLIGIGSGVRVLIATKPVDFR